VSLELTASQFDEFEQRGYTIVRGGFTDSECDRFVDYMIDLQAGRTSVEGFAPRAADDWSRLISRNCHHPMGLSWMLDPRLRQPLSVLLGEEADGVQSMFFYTGSEQRRHQDAFYLPGCMSAWVALQQVSALNGSIQIQVGSHKGPLLQKCDFHKNDKGGPGAWYGWNQDDAFDEQFTRNNLPEIAIEATKGDVVFFDGRLIHRGGPILEPGAFRHSWAGHYIPRSYNPWPYEDNPRLRVSFDGVSRFTPTE
jgi:phytanoyl-CoA hydroxylase|tara:strand:- start:1782 stop:2537 length:756 start_codon:yes stop_codon:yes gene_type:complete